jgi:hypothetical protein
MGHVTKQAEVGSEDTGGWPFLRTAGGKFKNAEGTVLANPFPMVILGTIRTNAYFPGKYDQDSAAAPDCFAIDFEGDRDSMRPPEDLATRVSDGCKACPKNSFGSGEGKGKACKNQTRIVALPWGPKADYRTIEGLCLTVPPATLKKWGAYNKRITVAEERPLYSVVTEVTIEPADGGGHTFSFECSNKPAFEDEEGLIALMNRLDTDGQDALHAQMIVQQDAAPAPKTKKRRPVKKK